MIDSGTFGRVRLVKHKQTNKFFAAKILKKIEILKSKQIDHVQNESLILSMLHHPFIVLPSHLDSIGGILPRCPLSLFHYGIRAWRRAAKLSS